MDFLKESSIETRQDAVWKMKSALNNVRKKKNDITALIIFEKSWDLVTDFIYQINEIY